MAVNIICIERVIVAVRALAESRENWRRAGFGIAPDEFQHSGTRIARLAAGAVEIDLCELDAQGNAGFLAAPLREALENGGGIIGGIIGWTWGVRSMPASDAGDSKPTVSNQSIVLPGLSEPTTIVEVLRSGLPGVVTAAAKTNLDIESRRLMLRELCGPNPNSVDYLEHIVVMTPVLEDAIAANEAVGVPCKRIREVGNGARQAFFKLEQTVLEVVGPARGRLGCWGLALMCTDIASAVAAVRAGGLQATEPKLAIQGGQIARIVEPLDGVAIAFMQSGPRRDD
jgi:predicted enzyme related to lactoylglutathione lyase